MRRIDISDMPHVIETRQQWERWIGHASPGFAVQVKEVIAEGLDVIEFRVRLVRKS